MKNQVKFQANKFLFVAQELLKQTAPQIPVSLPENSSEEIADVDPNEPMVKLPVNVLGSLKTALQKQSNTLSSSDPNQGDQTAVPSQMECENFGCHLKKPVSEVSEELELIEDCLHHPMPPVFHEGLIIPSPCSSYLREIT